MAAATGGLRPGASVAAGLGVDVGFDASILTDGAAAVAAVEVAVSAALGADDAAAAALRVGPPLGVAARSGAGLPTVRVAPAWGFDEAPRNGAERLGLAVGIAAGA